MVLQSNEKKADNQVLFISFWNPTALQPQQGIFIQEQAAAICSMRDNVIFLQVNILPAAGVLYRKTVEESVYFRNKRITINLSTRLWKIWYLNPWALSRIINRFIKTRSDEIDPAIIHANVIFPCGVTAYLLSKRLRARLIVSEHWSKAVKLLRHPLYKRIALKAYRSCCEIICVSGFLSKRISEATGLNDIVIIPNIIDTGLFRYLPAPVTEDGKLHMMCVASWRPPKRLDLIFEALCAFALESGRNIELTVAGSGEQADRLSKRGTPVNLKINWAGYLDRKIIAEMLHATDIFLHASDIETFSLVTAEALATGTPVLASRTGALPELITRENGILTGNTPEEWLNGLREITAVKFDRQAIASQNHEKYSSVRIGGSIISLYHKTMEEKSGC